MVSPDVPQRLPVTRRAHVHAHAGSPPPALLFCCCHTESHPPLAAHIPDADWLLRVLWCVLISMATSDGSEDCVVQRGRSRSDPSIITDTRVVYTNSTAKMRIVSNGVQPYIVQTGVDTDGETQEEVTTFRMKLDVSECGILAVCCITKCDMTVTPLAKLSPLLHCENEGFHPCRTPTAALISPLELHLRNRAKALVGEDRYSTAER
ncbi:hypothetical protein DPX16_8156 [Anabarilius grahami]|uniref:Uncharacterized protein n=1 Tax=Anabarilius grahami TaxID=495550 RepID=A0A3N0Y8B0_ANAGA|nr:hypothetical protein DPX16_8156 [Anabarilius grahami]